MCSCILFHSFRFFPAPAQVWEEGVSSEAGAIRLYAVEIVELLLQGLASQSWGRKKACAEAVGGLAEVSQQQEKC